MHPNADGSGKFQSSQSGCPAPNRSPDPYTVWSCWPWNLSGCPSWIMWTLTSVWPTHRSWITVWLWRSHACAPATAEKRPCHPSPRARTSMNWRYCTLRLTHTLATLVFYIWCLTLFTVHLNCRSCCVSRSLKSSISNRKSIRWRMNFSLR